MRFPSLKVGKMCFPVIEAANYRKKGVNKDGTQEGKSFRLSSPALTLDSWQTGKDTQASVREAIKV